MGEKTPKEINIKNMKMVSEKLKDFLNEFEQDDDTALFVSDSDFINTDDIDDNVEEIEIENNIDEMIKLFANELIAPEFLRLSFILKLKTGTIEAVPMAQLSGEAFLFKVEGQLKKIKISDILGVQSDEEEEEEEEVGEVQEIQEIEEGMNEDFNEWNPAFYDDEEEEKEEEEYEDD
jgi:hypothetical protein